MANNENNAPENTAPKSSSKMTSKRIIALLGVILLAAMYLITLIVSILDKSSSGNWFMLCLLATVTIPLLIWIYTWMYGMLTQKRTIASFAPDKKNPPADEEAFASEEPSDGQ